MPVAKRLNTAALAQVVLLVLITLRLHGLCTVLHAPEVRLLAAVALIEGAVLEGELFEFAKVIVTFSDHSAFFVIAFFFGHLDAELEDLSFEAKLFEKLSC